MKTAIRSICLSVLILAWLAGAAQSQTPGEDPGPMPVLFLKLEELTEADATAEDPQVLFLKLRSWADASDPDDPTDPVLPEDLAENVLLLNLSALLDEDAPDMPGEPPGSDPSPMLVLAFEALSTPLLPDDLPMDDQPNALLLQLWPMPENPAPDDPAATLLLALEKFAPENVSVGSTELLLELRHLGAQDLSQKITDLYYDWLAGLFPPGDDDDDDDDDGDDDEPGPIFVIPEPSTLALFGLGLLGMLALARKRRKMRK